jgi:succinate dehydrogenase/fumarate reductase flavoprotein subunit
VIRGLYAAGEVAGYQGLGTGCFTTGNIVFGRRAGNLAAAEALDRRH